MTKLRFPGLIAIAMFIGATIFVSCEKQEFANEQTELKKEIPAVTDASGAVELEEVTNMLKSSGSWQTFGSVSGSVSAQANNWYYYPVSALSADYVYRASLTTYSGDADMFVYYYDAGYRLISYSALGGTAQDNAEFKKSNIPTNIAYVYFRVYGYQASSYKMELQRQQTNFPATVLTSKSSSSKYATTENAFSAYAGQCTWYTYGRVVELADAGYLKSSVKTDFYNAFWGKTGRHAKNWPSFLGGTWTSTNSNSLPMEKRLKGLVAVWIFGSYGHVGFVEEVSADKTKYRLSDFNRGSDETYRNVWYDFEGTSDRLGGVYPYFYELALNE